MKNLGRIAFYGTLLRGEAGFVELGLRRRLRFLGNCEIPGLMYDLGDYPALVEGDGVARGELFEIEDGIVLAALDAFEGCDPMDPALSLFARCMTDLLNGGGNAWVYFYVAAGGRLPANAKPIRSGDWRRRHGAGR